MQTTAHRMNKQVLLYSTGNYIQCPLINHNGKEKKISRRIHKNCKQWLTLGIGENRDFCFPFECAVLFEFFTSYIIDLRCDFSKFKIPVKREKFNSYVSPLVLPKTLNNSNFLRRHTFIKSRIGKDDKNRKSRQKRSIDFRSGQVRADSLCRSLGMFRHS